MDDSDSFLSSSSEGSQENFQGNCSLCKVKLNQVGIHHTKCKECSQCRNKICINCLSTFQKYLDKGQKVCKYCAHKELLFDPENTEMDEMAEQRYALVIQIKRISTENNLARTANRELIKKIHEKKEKFDEKFRICLKEVEDLKIIYENLQVKISSLKSTSQLKQQEITELNMQILRAKSQVLEPESDIWSSNTEASKLQKALYIQSLETSLLKKSLYLYNHQKISKDRFKKAKLTEILINYLQLQLHDYKELTILKNKQKTLNLPRKNLPRQVLNNRTCTPCQIM
jgi:cell division protein FtsL